MRAFALYRLPGDTECHAVVGEPRKLNSLDEVDSTLRGYLIAPFDVAACPIVCISPQKEDLAQNSQILKDLPCGSGFERISSEDKEGYHRAFAAMHEQLAEGRVEKVVLARCSQIETQIADCETLFRNACQCYPHAFVSLFSTPFTGAWLVASPELLLRKDGDSCHTVALAGTMPVSSHEAWNEKNIREQRIVAEYISRAISEFCVETPDAAHLTQDTKEVQAGHLRHLRTDFDFRVRSDVSLGALLGRLHPTPAVCGYPKDIAMQLIKRYEPVPRGYFSGFSGPVGADDAQLYVTLRCMEIYGENCCLWAGGGLLAESEEEAEWQETQDKMKTICTAINKT